MRIWQLRLNGAIQILSVCVCVWDLSLNFSNSGPWATFRWTSMLPPAQCLLTSLLIGLMAAPTTPCILSKRWLGDWEVQGGKARWQWDIRSRLCLYHACCISGIARKQGRRLHHIFRADTQAGISGMNSLFSPTLYCTQEKGGLKSSLVPCVHAELLCGHRSLRSKAIPNKVQITQNSCRSGIQVWRSTLRNYWPKPSLFKNYTVGLYF